MSEKLDNFNEQRKEAFHSVLIPLSTFIIFFIVISLNEILDLPHIIFGASPTPINCVGRG